MNQPLNIALVTGGYSGEAVISYKSATTIYNHLDKSKFNVFVIDVTNEGWFYKVGDKHISPVDKNDFTITVDEKKISFD